MGTIQSINNAPLSINILLMCVHMYKCMYVHICVFDDGYAHVMVTCQSFLSSLFEIGCFASAFTRLSGLVLLGIFLSLPPISLPHHRNTWVTDVR